MMLLRCVRNIFITSLNNYTIIFNQIHNQILIFKNFDIYISKMWDLARYVRFSEKHFPILSTSKTSFYINIKRFYRMYLRLSIKIYANLYEMTHKFTKKCGARPRMNLTILLLTTRAKASTCLAREELVHKKFLLAGRVIRG